MTDIRPKKGTVIHAHSVDVTARKWGPLRKHRQTGTHNAQSAWAKDNVVIVVKDEYPSDGNKKPRSKK